MEYIVTNRHFYFISSHICSDGTFVFYFCFRDLVLPLVFRLYITTQRQNRNFWQYQKKKKNYLLQHIQIRKVWCSSLISVTWLFWQRNPRHWMAISLVISDLRKCIQEIFILPSNFHVRGCEVGWSPLLRTSPSSNYLPRSRLFLSKIKSLQKIPRENKWDSYENAWVQSK